MNSTTQNKTKMAQCTIPFFGVACAIKMRADNFKKRVSRIAATVSFYITFTSDPFSMKNPFVLSQISFALI